MFVTAKKADTAATIMNVKLNLIVLLIYIPLMTRDIEQYITCLQVQHTSPWGEIRSGPLPILSGLFVLYDLAVRVLFCSRYNKPLYPSTALPSTLLLPIGLLV